MVLKDISVRENISMDTGTRTSFTTRRVCTLSVTTLALLGAFFACTLLAVSFIVYNFAQCQQIQINHEQQRQNPHQAHYNNHLEDEEPLYPPQTLNENSIDIGKGSTPIQKLAVVDKDVRLPRSIAPVTYNISIIPFLEEGNFTFHGEVKIRINVTEDCHNITLHSTDLDILNGTTVKDLSGNVFPIKSTYFVEDKQFFIIMIDDLLKKDMQLEMGMKFIGQIADNLQGFYRSSYEKGNSKRFVHLFLIHIFDLVYIYVLNFRWIASTQFQPTDARRAFPCFDEPALKAKFTINIAVPKDMIAISNMPRDFHGMNEVV